MSIALTEAQFRGGPWDGRTFPVMMPPCPRFLVPRAPKGWHAYKWSAAMGVYIYLGPRDPLGN